MLRSLIDNRYSYKDIREIDWDDLFSRYAPYLRQEASPELFAKYTAEMLSYARDLHIGVRAGTQSFRVCKKRVIININQKGVDNLVSLRKLSDVVTFGTVKANPDIGYLAINSWGSGTDTAVVPVAISAISELQDKPVLIIDLRFNSGGSDGNANEVFSHLNAHPAVYERAILRDPQYDGGWSVMRDLYIQSSKDPPYYRGRVVVLSGQVCMSSCEGSLLMLRRIGGLIVGDTTRGSTGAPKEYDLGNAVAVKLPSWKAYMPDGTLIEGNGVPPDIRIDYLENHDYENSDPVLEAAIEQITSQR